jgi:endogenous inhibitor of DNA gyrase (YacG/DUF329 family)
MKVKDKTVKRECDVCGKLVDVPVKFADEAIVCSEKCKNVLLSDEY